MCSKHRRIGILEFRDEKTTKLCCQVLRLSTQRQNRSYHGIKRARTDKMYKNAKRACKPCKLLFFVVKYANCWRSCQSPCFIIAGLQHTKHASNAPLVRRIGNPSSRENLVASPYERPSSVQTNAEGKGISVSHAISGVLNQNSSVTLASKLGYIRTS